MSSRRFVKAFVLMATALATVCVTIPALSETASPAELRAGKNFIETKVYSEEEDAKLQIGRAHV